HQLLVVGRAVEELNKLSLLRLVSSVELQDLCAAGRGDYVLGLNLQRLDEFDAVGKKVDPVTEHSGAQRLERSPHAHANGRLLPLQGQDKKQPPGPGNRSLSCAVCCGTHLQSHGLYHNVTLTTSR